MSKTFMAPLTAVYAEALTWERDNVDHLSRRTSHEFLGWFAETFDNKVSSHPSVVFLRKKIIHVIMKR